MDEFLKRVEHVREDDQFLYKVSKAYVFGSYLSDKEYLGDIDLAVELSPKEKDLNKFNELRRTKMAKAHQEGRRFKSFVDELVWPDTEVWLTLKARSRGLSLHRFDDEMVKISKHRLIYKDAS